MNSMTRPKLHKHDKHAYKPISTIYLFFFFLFLKNQDIILKMQSLAKHGKA